MDTYEIPATSVLMWVVVCTLLAWHTWKNWKFFSLEYRWWFLGGGVVLALLLQWSIWSSSGIVYFFVWSLVWSLIKVRKSRVFRSTVPSTLNDSTLLWSYVVSYPVFDRYESEVQFRFVTYVWHLGNDFLLFGMVCGIGWVFDHLYSLFL